MLGVANESAPRMAGPERLRRKGRVRRDQLPRLQWRDATDVGREREGLGLASVCSASHQTLVVGVILRDFGWGIVDVGGIESSRYLEAMCVVLVIAAMRTNNWDQAFKLLRK
jgi:hypothetical protein